MIVYATDPGNVASDGTGRNGLFTAGLLTALRERQAEESLKQTLLRIRQFASLQQPIELDEFGDGASRFYLMRVHQGRFINAE